MENAPQTVKYTVTSRDTIAGIALKFDMPLAQFKQLNRLQISSQIFPGQVFFSSTLSEFAGSFSCDQANHCDRNQE
jgi:LysM repeat protein